MCKKLQLTSLLVVGILGYARTQNDVKIPIPTQAQLEWQNAELAALVCWDSHEHEGEFYVQSKARITPVEDYNIFNPQKYKTDQWIKKLKDAATLILGVTPNPEGLIPEADAIRRIEFGEEIETRFSNPIASTSGTRNTINLKLPEKHTVNRLVIMEDIARGERVREFILEGKTKDGWQNIFISSCIGHKFIH